MATLFLDMRHAYRIESNLHRMSQAVLSEQAQVTFGQLHRMRQRMTLPKEYESNEGRLERRMKSIIVMSCAVLIFTTREPTLTMCIDSGDVFTNDDSDGCYAYSLHRSPTKPVAHHDVRPQWLPRVFGREC